MEDSKESGNSQLFWLQDEIPLPSFKRGEYRVPSELSMKHDELGHYYGALIPICKNCKNALRESVRGGVFAIRPKTWVRLLAILCCGVRVHSIGRGKNQSAKVIKDQEHRMCGAEKIMKAWAGKTLAEIKNLDHVTECWEVMRFFASPIEQTSQKKDKNVKTKRSQREKKEEATEAADSNSTSKRIRIAIDNAEAYTIN